MAEQITTAQEAWVPGGNDAGRVHIVLVSAGMGTPSSTRLLGDRLLEAAVQTLRGRGLVVDTEVVELRELAVDIANNFVTGYAAPNLAEAVDHVTTADAVIAVTPVFTASYSGLFKSFFDLLDPAALDGKPMLIGATGGSTRHSLVPDMAMRPLFAYLRARVAATALFAGPDDWGSAADGTFLDSRVAQAGNELAAMVAGGGAPRRRRLRVEEESLPFEEMLARLHG